MGAGMVDVPNASSPPRMHAPGAHRFRDIAHCLLAEVLETGPEFAAHRHPHRLRHHDAASVCHRLQARGDIHPVAVDRAIGLADHVAQVQADAKAHLPLVRHIRHGLLNLLLRRHCRGNRPAGGLERRQHRVPGHIDHAPVARLDVNAKHLARGIQRGHRGGVVSGHQARESASVGCQDRRKAV